MYLVNYGSFKYAVSIKQYTVEWQPCKCTVDWQPCRTKPLWPSQKQYISAFLVGLMKTTYTSRQSAAAEIRAGHRPEQSF
jgi:hypothetical protein